PNVVVFLHSFPEIWYSWRYQMIIFLHSFHEIWYSWRHRMISLAAAGFRAIAPDFRSYSLSDPLLT
ncbi:hypothetical protein RYX36_021528, partial [Vicia faba]